MHDLLIRYQKGPDILEARLAGVAPELLDLRPTYPGAWTIREHVIHMVDSECNNFIRLKSIIAQPGSVGFVMDEEAWTRNLAHKREDVAKYTRLFRLLREIVVDLVADELEHNQGFFLRTYQGKTDKITLRQGLEIYARHVDLHMEFIDRILQNRSV